MFILSDSTNGYIYIYIYNFKPYTGKTENGNTDLLKTTQVVQSSRVILVAKRGASVVKGLTREGRAGRRVGPEGGFVTSLVGNICPAPVTHVSNG
jgi:hypothetical protein